MPKTRHIEVIGVQVRISGAEHIILSVYQSPNLPLLRDDLDVLFSLGNHVVVLGDFNAHHDHWFDRLRNTRGNILFNHMLENDYVIHVPDTPTQVNYRADLAATNPDLILALHTSSIDNVKAIHALSSNHFPIYFTIGGSVYRKPAQPVFNYKTADWNGYRAYIDTNIMLTSRTYKTIDEINDSIEKFQDCLIQARNKNVRLSEQRVKKFPRHIKRYGTYRLPHHYVLFPSDDDCNESALTGNQSSDRSYIVALPLAALEPPASGGQGGASRALSPGVRTTKVDANVTSRQSAGDKLRSPPPLRHAITWR
ncbi:endonuclease-reverse transcriptase domain-containing protein [Phthorimaea operculella]|nr:endonuclease-reverse transcriptase domain-containing protein [Phthorimaea operculella]